MYLLLDFTSIGKIFGFVMLPLEIRKSISMSLRCFVISGVEKQLVSICNQALGNCIFKKHPFIDGEIIVQNLFVQFSFGNLTFCKCMTDQKSGVAHIALDIGAVLIQGQPDIRVVAVEAFIGHHGIAEPKEGLLIKREICISINV